MSVEVVTFGCRLNALESEATRGEAARAGLTDTIVFNTCAVTAESASQARQRIRKARREHPAARLVVTGCAVQTEPQVFAAMPEVDRVIGNDEKLRPDVWTAIRDGAGARVSVSDIMAAPMRPASVAAMPEQTRAFVQVQNGCDHRCTFCVIPFGRGRSRSLPSADVVAQVRILVEGGHREVVLTGVDITSYAFGLGALVKAILRGVPDLARLRLSSIDSIEADRDLIDAFATEPRLMPHLHLSLQSGDDLILKRMKRRHTRADAIDVCARLRRLRPGIVFGADIIAGFPTETEAMFACSLDLIEDCGLTHLHVFPFSPRPGTPAARMPAVNGVAIKERAARLRATGQAALVRHLDREVGSRRRVLAEAGGIGRTEAFTPVLLPPGMARGTLAEVTIAGHDGARLTAG